ncbi:MAG: acetyl-CoA carboxylase biotin carboxyl carrier protein [Phycisphaerae bacterium]|nr:acetyl-CoA carboxylase biotin carboxyl carrier protein [Phycisphaerae bacterium]
MNIEHIRELVSLMVDNDLNRIEIQEGETHILLKRGQLVAASAPVVVSAPPAVHAPAPVAHAAPPPAPAPSASAPAAPAASSNETLIRSPMVGTFYSAADPSSPSFVKIGDSIGPSTVVCLIEAMKVFNEIKAEVSGRIARMLVNNGQAVEFDQPLFAVTPN